MTEKNIYTCDYCGKTFNEKDECEAHEFAHKVKEFNAHAKFYANGWLLDFDAESVDPCDDFFERVDAIICDDKETAKTINELYDENCLDTPFSVYLAKEQFFERVYYDRDHGYWRDADDVIEDIENRFRK